VDLLKQLLENHAKYTDSTVAKTILKNFDKELDAFVKVMPKDYKKVLVEVRKKMKEQGISEEAALYG
jgi:glutamate synthase domain-containing protein 3